MTIVNRSSWWMRSAMGLRDVTDVAPGPTPADLHGVGHGRGVFVARAAGVLMVTASLCTMMVAARPAAAADSGARAVTTQAVGAGLGALGVSSFVAGRVLARRTAYDVWLRCEARAITHADVGALLESFPARSPTAQLWLLGAAVEPEARSLARDRGVRCFVMQGRDVREV